MQTVLEDDRAVVLHGDSAHILEVLAPNSIDAIVTDPPSGISFMGKAWDGDKGGRNQWIAWLRDIVKPALVALKPGGYALVWALPRTSHWTATALEDAGFEIRDVHHHFFGTGFPKSLDMKKATDGAPGSEGIGTALKPAVEHWILARKPIEGTYADNWLTYRTGGLNIDACRIGTAGEVIHDVQSNPANRSHGEAVQPGAGGDVAKMQAAQRASIERTNTLGRWPSHLSFAHADTCGTECVIGCPVRVLDEQSGATGCMGTGSTAERREGATNFGMKKQGMQRSDKGGASRFYYVAKGSRSEKDEGLDHLEAKTGGEATGREDDSAGVGNPRAGAGRTGGARNFHPTVKSVSLMRWLVRLITPPGGTVLDMFAGSGTTGVAALAEGCTFVGVEQGGENGEYLPILVGRIAHALKTYPARNSAAA